jgi:hypothetical protein
MPTNGRWDLSRLLKGWIKLLSLHGTSGSCLPGDISRLLLILSYDINILYILAVGLPTSILILFLFCDYVFQMISFVNTCLRCTTRTLPAQSVVRFAARARCFCFLHIAHTGSGAQPHSRLLVMANGVKRPDHEAPVHLVPKSRICGAIYLLTHLFNEWCLIRHSNNRL